MSPGNYLNTLWQQAWALILVEMSPQEIGWLVRPREHISLLSVRRTTIIVTRVRLMAGLFAIITPCWLLLDILVFPSEIWKGLLVARLATTLAFIGILLMLKKMDTIQDACRALAMLITVPMAFFLFTYLHISQFQLQDLQAAVGSSYAFLPFVVVAGLAIFPLTLLECLLFSLPVIVLQGLAASISLSLTDWPALVASFWMLMLITGIASMAGLSQLAFMIVLVREAIRDGMTGAYSRNSGEELLELQFILSARGGTPLSLAFIDLDHFKRVNDKFGHEAGDEVLKQASEAIRNTLRTGDMLVRWGGEEFLLILPNSDREQALLALERLRQSGLGNRPDGTPLTASIGVAERISDEVDQWSRLVEMADSRMYQAKRAGRNRVVA